MKRWWVEEAAWGEVRVAKFCGVRVTAKFLYDIILSHYNQRHAVCPTMGQPTS